MALGALDIIIAADTAQLRKGMDTAVGIMQTSTQKMENFAKTAGSSIAGYFALSNLRDSIKSTIDYADSLGKMSQKIGMSVDSLYALSAAGKLADADISQIESALKKFNKGLGEAELGTGDTANALKNLGISLKDSQGNMKGTDEYLYEVADKFASMPDGVEKTTLAMQLFGKSGADLIPLLDGGSASLKEFSGIMNDETAAASQNFNDSLTKLHLSMESVGGQMVSALAPTLQAVADDFFGVAKSGREAGRTLGDDLAVGVKYAVELGYQAAGSFTMAGHAIGNFAAAASLLAEGDLSGAKFAWDKISSDWIADGKAWDERYQKIHEATKDKYSLNDNDLSRARKDLVDYKKIAEEKKKAVDDIAKAKLDAMRDNAEHEANAALDIYNSRELAIQQNYDNETQWAIERYNDELDLIERNANALASSYDRAYELITPEIDKLNQSMMEDWQRLYEAGLMEGEFADKFYAAWQKKSEDTINKTKDDTIKLNTVFEDAFKSMEDSMVKMFMTGKFSAQDFFNTVIEGIIRMQIRNSITQPLTQAIGGFDFGALFSGSVSSINPTATSEFGMVDGVSYGGYYKGGFVQQFASGGYTGDGGQYEPKGVVHGGEYVIPKWMVQKSPALIGSLEYTRKRGYADGGLVESALPGTAAPSMPVTINIENKSGTPISAENVGMNFDIRGMTVNIVVDAINRNVGGLRDSVRAVR